MNREDEIEQRWGLRKERPQIQDAVDIAYLLTRVRQLEGRLPPTSVDVAGVRERLAKATPGPWFVEHLKDDILEGYYVGAGRPIDGETICYYQADSESGQLTDEDDPEQIKADLSLIANAPTDLAVLCDELDHWRAVAAMLLSDNDSERVQAAVWETRRQVVLECCKIIATARWQEDDEHWVDTSEEARQLLYEIRRRFGLEDRRRKGDEV